MITTYNNFILKNKNNQKNIVNEYINNVLNDDDIVYYFENLNENLNLFNFSFIKEKIVNILYSLLDNAYKFGQKIINKINFLFKQIFNLINKLKTKYPTLYKLIILSIITFIILIITAISAHAATNNTKLDIQTINTAIGWLDYLKTTTNYDNIELSKAIAHLVDLKDGKIDIINLNKNSLDMADSAVKTATKIIEQSKADYLNGDDDGNKSIKLFIELLEKGKTYIGAIYTKTSNTENIKLVLENITNLAEKYKIFFSYLNKLLFNNTLPIIDFKIVNNDKIGASFNVFGIKNSENIITDISEIYFNISNSYTFSDKELKEILAHEMIHYYIIFNKIPHISEHDDVFNNILNYLNNYQTEIVIPLTYKIQENVSNSFEIKYEYDFEDDNTVFNCYLNNELAGYAIVKNVIDEELEYFLNDDSVQTTIEEQLKILNYPNKCYILEHLETKKTFRNKGVGKILLDNIEKYIIKNNGDCIVLNASPMDTNLSTIELELFYKKNNYKTLLNQKNNTIMYKIL